MKKNYKEKLPHITTFIFDIDGVFTTGEVILFQNEFVRTLHSKDAYAIQYAKKMGYRLFAITGGESEQTKRTLEAIGLTHVYLNSANKVEVYNACKKEYNFTDEEVLYMGDDLPDYPLLQIVNVSTCPQDAAPEIKKICDYQSPIFGGKGCVRDVIEQTLKSQNKWFSEHAFVW